MNKKIKVFAGIAFISGLFMSVAAFASETAAPDDKAGGNSILNLLPVIAVYGLLFVALYFIMIRPQKKRQKKEEELRGSVILGDQVTTIGGVTGRVVQIKDDEITLESSLDRTLVSFKKWAIRDVQKLETDDPVDKK